MGGLPKEYQILADPHKMRYYDVSLDELLDMSEGINTDISGGIINEFGKEYYIRAIGRTRDVKEIGNSVIKIREGRPVKISDVARVQLGRRQEAGHAPHVIVAVSANLVIHALENQRLRAKRFQRAEHRLQLQRRVVAVLVRPEFVGQCPVG